MIKIRTPFCIGSIHPMHNTVSELETGNELHQNEVGRPSTRYFFRVFPTQCSFRSKSDKHILKIFSSLQ